MISGAINKEFPFLEDLMLLFPSVTTAFNLALPPSISNLQEPPLMLQKFKHNVKQDNKSQDYKPLREYFSGKCSSKGCQAFGEKSSAKRLEVSSYRIHLQEHAGITANEKKTTAKSNQLLYNLPSSEWPMFLGHSINRKKFTMSIKHEIFQWDNNF